MLNLRPVTETFAVAPQIAPEDVGELKALGFTRVIVNRPDGEEPGQPRHAAMKAAVEAAGLSWHEVPVSGPPPASAVAAMQTLLETPNEGRTLAYCRSGTRSVTLWVLAQTASGAMGRDEALAAARAAGYALG
jgi:uncharacterized protein (TIGR01244 family)